MDIVSFDRGGGYLKPRSFVASQVQLTADFSTSSDAATQQRNKRWGIGKGCFWSCVFRFEPQSPKSENIKNQALEPQKRKTLKCTEKRGFPPTSERAPKSAQNRAFCTKRAQTLLVAQALYPPYRAIGYVYTLSLLVFQV